MPYLEFLFCEHCGDHANLDLDQGATLDAYSREQRQQVFINPATLIWDYLIYTCSICGRKYKYTYRDVERRVREYFSSMSHRYKEYFEEMIRRADGEIDQSDETTQEPVGAMADSQNRGKRMRVAERVHRLYGK